MRSYQASSVVIARRLEDIASVSSRHGRASAANGLALQSADNGIAPPAPESKLAPGVEEIAQVKSANGEGRFCF
jgi:hypothetical protein